MQSILKKSALLFLTAVFFASVSAFETTTFDYNSTKLGVNITNTTNLYAYEISFDYTGTSAAIQQYNFLGPPSITVYDSIIKDNILSVYGSRLDPNRTGINSSGMLFNVSHSGGSITLKYTIAVYSDGTTVYTYYNNTCGNGVCDSGETCSSCSQDCGGCGGGGGGGGGGGSSGGGGRITPFTFTPELLQLTLVEGRNQRENILLTNIVRRSLQIVEVDLGDLSTFIAAYVPSAPFFIPERGYTDFYIDFFARKGIKPDVYTGEIKFKTAEGTETLPVILQVVEEQPLFDVTVSLERDQYAPGDIALASLDIQNFGDKKDIDVIIHYSIRNFAGEELVFEEGSYAIDNYKLQLITKLRVPRDVALGEKLIYYVQVTYPTQNISASASSVFTIVEPDTSPFGSGANLFLIIFIPIALVAIIIITIVIIINVTKSRRRPSA